ncbi:MAG TPA: ABC transporter substrate-binding protein, partial [Galbitalea sp.]|nr:ABC transporter substrate-binding protein [Galbitalea sp.]
MKRKLIASLAVAGVAALVMTGCASTPAKKADSGPVTITYTNFISDGANVGNLTKIVNAFEKANPNITVNVKTIPYSGYATAQQTDLAAGTESDVFDIDGLS